MDIPNSAPTRQKLASIDEATSALIVSLNKQNLVTYRKLVRPMLKDIETIRIALASINQIHDDGIENLLANNNQNSEVIIVVEKLIDHLEEINLHLEKITKLL